MFERDETDPNAIANAEAEAEAEDAGKLAGVPKVGDPEPDADLLSALDDDVEPEPADEDDDPLEEIEHKGQKLKVPKSLKEGAMREADYRKKTAEAARLREAAEAERAAVKEREKQLEAERETTNKFLVEVGELRAIDAERAEYARVDWEKWIEQDPTAAQKAQVRLNLLNNRRQEIGSKIANKIAEDRQRQEAERSKTRTEFETKARAEIKDYDKRKDEIAKEAVAAYGFKAEEIADFIDVRAMRALADAVAYRKLLAKAKAGTAAPQQKVVPLRAKLSGGGGSAQADPSDKDTDAEWERKEYARMQKIGKIPK